MKQRERLRIYLICPVRRAGERSEEELQEIADYVAELEAEGHLVHWPPRDVEQDVPRGTSIIRKHRAAMRYAQRVDIFWDPESKGSHFDLGMAIALYKDLHLVRGYGEDVDCKSFWKVIEDFETGNMEAL